MDMSMMQQPPQGANRALQQQQKFGMSPIADQPLPRGPVSPGSWNLGVQDFAGTNATLRRNLANLQQQQHQPALSSIGGPQIPNMAGGGGFHLTAGGFQTATTNSLQHGVDDTSSNVNVAGSNKRWASELLRRSNPTGPVHPMNNVAVNSFMPSAPSSDESLMQLQLLRQSQQERMRQLEQQERLRQLDQQLSEDAAMRRQLQLLRRNSNLSCHAVGGNFLPVDTPSSNSLATSGNGNSFGSFPSDLPSSFGGSMFQQQLSHQQQLLQMQTQQQQNQQTQFEMLQQQHSQLLGFQNSLDNSIESGRPMSTSRSIPLQETSLEEAASSASARQHAARATPAVARFSSLPSSIARATPMLGPIAPPVPAAPEGGQQYRIPPIEEGETRHYDHRIHVPLSMQEDQNWLSEFQCFVRSELLQVFRASQQDVKIRVASKKVYYEQVGIRCRYCAHWKPNTRAIRSSAFPSSIRQLYQSFTMMLRDHFGNCSAIPADKKERFLALKRNNTQGASDSMRYWIYSAVKLGMVDSDCGIVLNEQTQAAARNKLPFGTASQPDGGAAGSMDSPPRLLINPDDLEQRVITSEFLYTLLTQFQLIRLLPTECIGNRKSLRPGVPGLGCRYCCQAGRLGLSRIFPAKKKQVATQIQDLYDHIRRCNLCPPTVKEELERLKEDRDRQRREASAPTEEDEEDSNLKIVDEDDKGFINLLWQRLGHRGELATPIAPSQDMQTRT
jgi:hypothetical protein